MSNRELLKEIRVSDADIEAEFQAAFGDDANKDFLELATENNAAVGLDFNSILNAKVVALSGNEAVLDRRAQERGASCRSTSGKTIRGAGRVEVDVLVEDIDPETGMILVSKRRADRILNWRRIVESTNEGDTVSGRVLRKIKGGLLVDIGVPVFLPASQVDIRRPADVGEYIGQEIEAKILKIDKERRNIVISRRKLIEEERASAKAKLLEEIDRPDSARAWSRTSPTSARSSTSAASTACCTSPTCPGIASSTRARCSRSTRRSRSRSSPSTASARRSPWASSRRPRTRGRRSPSATRSARA
jgi:small subunit ribosomal protein S1